MASTTPTPEAFKSGAPPHLRLRTIRLLLLLAAIWSIAILVVAPLVILSESPPVFLSLLAVIALIAFHRKLSSRLQFPAIQSPRTSQTLQNFAFAVTLVSFVFLGSAALLLAEPKRGDRYFALTFATLALAILPYPIILFPLARTLTRWTAQGIRHEVCPTCHYDLRSTPDPTGPRLPQCPECGTVISNEAPNSKLQTNSKSEKESSK